ncbi:hypothetical protein [Nocardioides daphniae]|uniref:Uncharacterized protein n=1 Tax=Nocardioides daphniae TaxID=402297 RepID=A0A4P7UCQ5_9ACTN|nr:hypothetical protein [Nocardioides daphniae]QCC76709.1 hypothetical protein E2C04_04795 [Nocardioides daphniae]GGD15553.1 hypothetical protein GCM10007231_13200 [Nocardioides daphniae]
MGRRISHSEERWQQMEWAGSPVVRCAAPTQAGTRCKREALAGSIVCDKHGGHLPNVQKRAKERYVNLADQAREVVEGILNNPKSSDAARLKAAEMVMKATGMEDAKKVVVDIETDPVEKLFRNLLGDPEGLAPRRVDHPAAPPAIEAGEVVRGEVLDPVQDAYDAFAESHTPDAEVVSMRAFGEPGPYAHRQPSMFDAPTDAAAAKQAARIPKHIRDDLDAG